MLGPNVEETISTKRGNCRSANKVTGAQASRPIGIAAVNAVSMEAIEKNNAISPMLNLIGKALRKSSSE
ncbi:hypothetical protein MANES_11G126302v8 [Manihot esculenta]|uniref:Uncharacterized protein n=1 Tax=Manihot esculenta TaxID=3983 RepID=A0ACB7GXQ7_MANES|nr:hypothetical protein MANES_11G126302v8 [Manihot esculenta]